MTNSEFLNKHRISSIGNSSEFYYIENEKDYSRLIDIHERREYVVDCFYPNVAKQYFPVIVHIEYYEHPYEEYEDTYSFSVFPLASLSAFLGTN